MERRIVGLAMTLLITTVLAGCAPATSWIPDVVPGVTIGCIDPDMESAMDTMSVGEGAEDDHLPPRRFPGEPINYEPRVCGVIPHG